MQGMKQQLLQLFNFRMINMSFLCIVQVSITGEWQSWQGKVPQIEVETHKVASPDVVVPTLDTVRHEALLYTWLAEHKPLVLCGPPGSGKTMTLFSALRALPDMEVRHWIKEFSNDKILKLVQLLI